MSATARKLFTRVNVSEPYTDYEAGCNYRSPAAAVRLNLSYDASTGKWAATLLQEDGQHEGSFEVVIDREISAAHAAYLLEGVSK